MNDVRFGAVILAAGRARRMQGIDKLLLPVGGRPLVKRTFDTLREAGVGPIVVVTGHSPERIAALFEGTDARLVHNERHDEGRQRSVLAGLAALRDDADAVLVQPGDQPLLAPADIQGVLDAWRRRPAGTEIVVPWHRGARGNPVVFAASLIERIVGGEGGARGFVDRHPELVQRYEAPNDHVCVDLDTQEDLRRYEVRARAGG